MINIINKENCKGMSNTSTKSKSKNKLGQYFTKHHDLKSHVSNFIFNYPCEILEPSVGQGDLVLAVKDKYPKAKFDLYEIDKTIPLLPSLQAEDVTYCDFMTADIRKLYKTIIGNPPYIRTRKGNLYIDFIKKCHGLLEHDGELIFVVPSDFLKLTCASKLLDNMMKTGTFTHIYHPNNEKLFENASIDVIVFRYVLDPTTPKRVLYNGELLYIHNNNGMITFNKTPNGDDAPSLFSDYFDIYVGLVSGKDQVYKNQELGNIEVLGGENKRERYIYLESFPCDNPQVNEHLLAAKESLLTRRIRRFNETNWFQWGAPRNIKTMTQHKGEPCIYIYNLTRSQKVAFAGEVGYFGGGLIMLKPKRVDIRMLENVVLFLNSKTFRENFTFAGRFKIGHRQISNCSIPEELGAQ